MTTSKKECNNKDCRKYGRTEDMVKLPNGRYFCNSNCIQDVITKDRLKRREQARIAQNRAKKKKDKQISKDLRDLNRRTLSWQHSHTQTSFNRMRKLQEFLWFKKRELEPTCISCGKPNMDWCTGHYKSRGSSGHLRYDRHNTFLQCNKNCNKSLSGNIEGNANFRGFKQGLRDRFGDKDGELIMEYCEQDKVYKWTCEELESMRKEFNAEIRKLEQLN